MNDDKSGRYVIAVMMLIAVFEIALVWEFVL